MPRFVILRHEPVDEGGKPLHWDLMLETPEGLRTWALASAPTCDGDIEAEELPVHRREYLDYEGELSGGRGLVRRWDSGSFDWLSQELDTVIIRLNGQHTPARLTLSGSGELGRHWTARFSSK